MAVNRLKELRFNEENQPVMRMKSIKENLVSKRAALGDLSNKLDNHRNNLISKPKANEQIVIYDPDKDVKDDPQMVAPYMGDIYKYLRELEEKFPIKKDFLNGSKTSPKSRMILVDWLISVHKDFKLNLQTLYICISLLDRYLQKNPQIGKNNLQLVGTTCLLLACKYEEIYIPNIEDFEYICDKAFTVKEILKTEQDILKTIDFFLGKSTALEFLRRYSKLTQATVEQHNLSKYLIESSLIDYEWASVKPSLQAAAACCLSMAILKDVMDLNSLWTPTLIHYTTYKYSDIRPYIYLVGKLLYKSLSDNNFVACRDKYAHVKYSKISKSPLLNCQLIKKINASK